MKKVFILLGVASMLITVCLISLIRSHIGVRPETMIKPSVLTDDSEVARAVFLRLAPQFQNAHYIVVADNSNSAAIFADLKKIYEKVHRHPVSVLSEVEQIDDEKLRACANPCWIFAGNSPATELDGPSTLIARLELLGQNYFTLTSIGFKDVAEVPDTCVQQKKLSFDCLISVSVHEAQRKMRDPAKQYFFLRKYRERDFFLFIQEAKASADHNEKTRQYSGFALRAVGEI